MFIKFLGMTLLSSVVFISFAGLSHAEETSDTNYPLSIKVSNACERLLAIAGGDDDNQALEKSVTQLFSDRRNTAMKAFKNLIDKRSAEYLFLLSSYSIQERALRSKIGDDRFEALEGEYLVKIANSEEKRYSMARGDHDKVTMSLFANRLAYAESVANHEPDWDEARASKYRLAIWPIEQNDRKLMGDIEVEVILGLFLLPVD